MKVHVTFEMFISLLVIVISFSYSLLVMRSLLYRKIQNKHVAVLCVLHLAKLNFTEPIDIMLTSKTKFQLRETCNVMTIACQYVRELLLT